MKNLVIVESPAKGKTIEKFLGKDFTVKASMGHIRDLEKKNLGIDIENGFAPTYVISDEKKKTVTELKKLAKSAEKVWIATDEDREWEAIGWHLCAALGLDPVSVSRIVFHEITKGAIEKAIETPRHIDMDLVNAQQSRRILDRLVGFKVSPVLWQKIKQGLSAGRVQSVAVKLIVEREREIKAFVPEESWKLKARLTSADGSEFDIEFAKLSGKGKTLKKREDMMKILESLGLDAESSAIVEKKDKKGNIYLEIALTPDFRLDSSEVKDLTRVPAAPFTTSTLQQEASRKLGMSVGQTMSTAQNLYQNGFITYMRTDSVNLSDFAIKGAHEYIAGEFGEQYALPNGRHYKTKQANAQEAHEAIRPSYFNKPPEVSGLTAYDLRLYKLIWERTIASQMKEAQIQATTYFFVPTADDTQTWIAKGEVVKFPGFMKLYVEWNDDEEGEDTSKMLPFVEKGAILRARMIAALQAFSRPPSRYTEAALVKKLESEGIGRPSTYAPTISTIVERGYVEKIEKKLAPTDIAFTVNDFLEASFKEMMDYKFTAKVEEEFDKVSAGELDWVQMLTVFYDGFSKELEKVSETKGKVQEKAGRACPKCGKDLMYKFSRNGKFVGCSGYPECDYLENIEKPGEAEALAALKERYEGKPCPAGGTIVVKTGRFGPFLASSLYPEVKWIGKVQDPKIEALEEKFGGAKCEACGTGTMHVKPSRRGPFLACSNYPECKTAANLPKEAIAELNKKEEESSEEEASE